METGVKVGEVMLKKPISIGPDMLVADCAKLMAKRRVSSVIVESDMDLKGILTEKDIVRRVIAAGLDPGATPVSKIMSKSVKTISPEKDIFAALDHMRSHNIRQMPVSDGSKMVGLLTQREVLRLQPNLFDILLEKMDQMEDSRSLLRHMPEREGLCEDCGRYTSDIVQHLESMLCRECLK